MPQEKLPKKTKPIISLDFDGVIHSYDKWRGPIPTGEPIQGALETINWLLDSGFELFILSTRAWQNPEGKKGIEVWLSYNGFPSIEVTSDKRQADIYVDDRGFRFEGPQSWAVLKQLLSEKPYPGRWQSDTEI